MDRFGEWRPIEPSADAADEQPKPGPAAAPAEAAPGREARLIGLLVATVVVASGAFVWMTSTRPAAAEVALSGQGAFFDTAGRTPVPTSVVAALAQQFLVVDVEGAVTSPGLQRLAAGSRVGDAIAAAGGYSALIDIAAAAARLNLAQPLSDGDKVHVPARGEATETVAPASVSADVPNAPGGLIDVNKASADELDTLPGIGPVTAAKIIAAREEAPFGTIDELLSREVVGASTLEKIRGLITAGR